MDDNKDAVIPVERVEQSIYLIRGQKVILDRDLAALYGVPTKALKQAVRRNARRFPPDFMFVLVPQEFATLRSQFVTSRSDDRGGTQYSPMESKYDEQFRAVFEVLDELMKPENQPRKQIGYAVREARARYSVGRKPHRAKGL